MPKDVKMICPLMGGKPCVEDGTLVDGELVGCKFWIHLNGNNPNNPKEKINRGDCSFAWLPILMIDNTSINLQTGAAVESLRNELVESNEKMIKAALMASENKKANINISMANPLELFGGEQVVKDTLNVIEQKTK